MTVFVSHNIGRLASGEFGSEMDRLNSGATRDNRGWVNEQWFAVSS